MRKLLAITADLATCDELYERAHRAGCSVSALAALCISYGLARLSDDKLATWAVTRAPKLGRPAKVKG